MKGSINTNTKKTSFTNQSVITYVLAFIWLINGLYCKVLQQVPRHQQIVERIIGNNYGEQVTRLIGIGEVVIAIWIVSGRLSQLSAITQIALIAVMNIVEYFLAADLLLFGKRNIVLACLLIVIIYYNEWIIKKNEKYQKNQ